MLSVFLLSLYMCCVVCLWASLPELNRWMDGWMDILKTNEPMLVQLAQVVHERGMK